MEHTLPIGTFKTQCYQLSQQVVEEESELIITKHGKPFIRVLPYAVSTHGKLNALKGTATWTDDLIDPVPAEWSVMKED